MKALVTGGGGFLGSAIVTKLLARGVEVVSLARGEYPQLSAVGVRCVRGDVADFSSVKEAAQGCDIVFHVAAKAGIWGEYSDYHSANVVGTENVLRACRECGIPRLIYTSSPSVVHGGGSLEGVDESTPYPRSYHTHYPRTKAEAERLVMAANGPDLLTVSLRPHLIWGPGDVHFVPRIVSRHQAGRLALVGDGRKKVDAVYIDNAADAHLLAMDALKPGAACAGRTYFISNDDPIETGEFISQIARAAGLPPVTRHVSPAAAYLVGSLLEVVWTLFRLRGEPPMTRFLASQLSTAHWYNIAAAKRDLNYVPQVSMTEGMLKLAQSLQTSDNNTASPRA